MTNPTHTLPTPADQREAPAVTFVPATDDHDSAAVLTYRGVTVTVTLRSRDMAAESGTDAGTVLVMVDTDPEAEGTPLSLQLNDSDVFEGVVR